MKKIIFLSIDFILLFASAIYFIFKPKKVLGKNWPEKKCEKTLLLANGPSLKVDMLNVEKDRERSEVYVLNYFALTEYFTKIKPEYYVLTDRMYWDQNANDDIKMDNEKLFYHLEKVDWKMNIVVPNKGFNYINKRLMTNNNIRVLKINSVNVEFKNEYINLFALDTNIVTPHFINGFVMVLWHAIYRKKLNIEIYGADFSLFKEYYVDQKTNELFNSLPHFYENTKSENNASYKYPNEKKKMLHTRMYQQWSSFYQMYLLSMLAKNKGIQITNLSSNSFLDCFDRGQEY